MSAVYRFIPAKTKQSKSGAPVSGGASPARGDGSGGGGGGAPWTLLVGEPSEGNTYCTVLYSYMWRPSCFLLKHGGGTVGMIKVASLQLTTIII